MRTWLAVLVRGTAPPARRAPRRRVTRPEGPRGAVAGRPAKLAAAAVASGLLAAACGSPAQPAAGPAGNTHDPSGRAQLEAVVQCLRAHGVPDFPDPVYDPGDGRWHYADFRPAIPQRAQQACQHLDPAAAGASPPVPQAQFQALARLARCIRHHGVPAWPDPTPQGQFRLPPSLLAKSPAQENAVKACQRYIPSGGTDVGAAP